MRVIELSGQSSILNDVILNENQIRTGEIEHLPESFVRFAHSVMLAANPKFPKTKSALARIINPQSVSVIFVSFRSRAQSCALARAYDRSVLGSWCVVAITRHREGC